MNLSKELEFGIKEGGLISPIYYKKEVFHHFSSILLNTFRDRVARRVPPFSTYNCW